MISGEGRCALGSLMESRKVLHDNVMVVHSSLLIVMKPRDMFFGSFRVMHTIESGNSAQLQNLRFRQHAPHPAKQVSPGSVQS